MRNDTRTPSTRYRLYGTIGSPYALKLRALMRYKRLPFDWVPAQINWLPEDLPHPPLCEPSSKALADLPLRVIPALLFPDDGQLRNESTAIAYLLDARHPQRPILPSDPGAAFLSHLIEDMADEWLVKIAFLNRWGNNADAQYKSRIVTGELLGGGYEKSIFLRAAEHFALRQQSRMPLVGCTKENIPVLELTFNRLLNVMDNVAESFAFLFGDSPTLADFGLYGQLQSLATDPTPSSKMRERAPGVFPYLQLLDDSSGIEPSQVPLAKLGGTTIGLLRLATEIYLPYLRANERALIDDKPELSFEVDGIPYTQAPFKFHRKCLSTLRDEFAALPRVARDGVRNIVDLDPLLSNQS